MVYHIQSWILPEESLTISSIGTFWMETRQSCRGTTHATSTCWPPACFGWHRAAAWRFWGRQQIKFGAMGLRTCTSDVGTVDVGRCWQMLAFRIDEEQSRVFKFVLSEWPSNFDKCCFQQTRGPMTWLTIVEIFLPQAHDTIVGKWPPHTRLDNVMTDGWAFPGLPKLLEFYERCLGIEDSLPRAFLFYPNKVAHDRMGHALHMAWKPNSITNKCDPPHCDWHPFILGNESGSFVDRLPIIQVDVSSSSWFSVFQFCWSIGPYGYPTYPHIFHTSILGHPWWVPGGSLVGRWLPRDADPAPWRLRGVAGPEAPRELQPAGPGFGGGAANTGRVSKLLIYDSVNIVWCCIPYIVIMKRHEANHCSHICTVQTHFFQPIDPFV